MNAVLDDEKKIIIQFQYEDIELCLSRLKYNTERLGEVINNGKNAVSLSSDLKLNDIIDTTIIKEMGFLYGFESQVINSKKFLSNKQYFSYLIRLTQKIFTGVKIQIDNEVFVQLKFVELKKTCTKIEMGLVQKLLIALKLKSVILENNIFMITFQQEPDDIKTEGEKRFKVLLVDDDKTTLKILQKLLPSFYLNIELETAINASSAFTMFTQQIEKMSPYDVIITDVNMDLQNGLVLLERVRNYEEQNKISRCYITICSSDSSYKRLAYNSDNFVQKPINKTNVHQLIKKKF